MFDGKNSAEAAAIFRAGQVNDLRAFHVGEQGARLTINSHSAQGVAGWVISEDAVPARAHVGGAEFIHEVFGELVDS